MDFIENLRYNRFSPNENEDGNAVEICDITRCCESFFYRGYH